MSKITGSILFAAVAFLILTGCQSPVQVGANAIETGSGRLVITLPPIATALAAQINSAKSLARVYAYATSYTVSVQTSTGSQVVFYTGSTANSATPVVIGVPVGSDFTVTLKIYNANVSANTPTVIGTATGVVITNGGTTALNLTCVPYSPSTFSPGSPVSPALNMNGEVYYALAVTAGSLYTFTQTTSGMLLGLFDSTGAALNNWSVTNGPVSYTATSNTTIYVGLAATLSSFGYTTLTATVAASQGTPTSPVPLPLGTPFTFRLGAFSGPNSTSYYSFTPTSTGTILLDLGSSAGTYSATLYTGSIGGTSVLSSTASTSSPVNLGTLTASTTYYLTVQNNSTNPITSSVGSLAVPTALSLAGTYTPGTVTTPYQTVWYSVAVTGGSSYNVNWDDALQGSGAYTLPSDVSAYKTDMTAYFTGAYDGYLPASAWTVIVPATQSTVYLKVRALYGVNYVGTFGIKIGATPPPVASLTCTTPVTAGNQLTLNGGASTGATSYTWTITSKPTGSVATIASFGSSYSFAYFTPDVIGNYSFLLTVTNSVGTSTATLNVTAAAPPPPVVSATCAPMTAGGSQLTLNGSGTTGASSYAWTILTKPTGSIATITSANYAYASFSPDMAGTYTFQLAATNLGGTSTATVSATVTSGTLSVTIN